MMSAGRTAPLQGFRQDRRPYSGWIEGITGDIGTTRVVSGPTVSSSAFVSWPRLLKRNRQLPVRASETSLKSISACLAWIDHDDGRRAVAFDQRLRCLDIFCRHRNAGHMAGERHKAHAQVEPMGLRPQLVLASVRRGHAIEGLVGRALLPRCMERQQPVCILGHYLHLAAICRNYCDKMRCPMRHAVVLKAQHQMIRQRAADNLLIDPMAVADVEAVKGRRAADIHFPLLEQGAVRLAHLAGIQYRQGRGMGFQRRSLFFLAGRRGAVAMVMKLGKPRQRAGETHRQGECGPPVWFCTPAVWAGKEHCNANLPCASGSLLLHKRVRAAIGRPPLPGAHAP